MLCDSLRLPVLKRLPSIRDASADFISWLLYTMDNSHNMEDYDLHFNKHCNQLRKIINLIIPTLKS
jgi:hypothetical protein